MANSINPKLHSPIVFRTCEKEVYDFTLSEGSIWLRSNAYYQQLEDEARCDKGEGTNATRLEMPINMPMKGGGVLNVVGNGSIGQEIIPHYIMSLHGLGIKEAIRQEFGGNTLGIKCLDDLAAEVLYQASKQLRVKGYRYGQVAYQHTALMLSPDFHGSAIALENVALKFINTDVLRKDPIEPFISQDEWRIVLFTEGYLDKEPAKPLKINVDPEHFYPYLEKS